MQMKKVIPLILIMLFTLTGCAIPLFNTKAKVEITSGTYDLSTKKGTIGFKTINGIKSTIQTVTMECVNDGNVVVKTISNSNIYLLSSSEIKNGDTTVEFRSLEDIASNTYTLNIKVELKDDNGNKFVVTLTGMTPTGSGSVTGNTKPTGVTANKGTGMIGLTWTAPAITGKNILGYNIYIATSSNSEFKKLSNGKSPNISFATNMTLFTGDVTTAGTDGNGVITIASGGEYYFKVSAVTDDLLEWDKSDVTYSYVENAATQVIMDGDLKHDIGLYNDGTRLVAGVKLWWTPKAGATYVIFKSDISRDGPFSKIKETSDTYYIDSTELIENKPVYYRVACREAVNGLGKWSGAIAEVNDPMPESITGVKATANNGYQAYNSGLIALNWTGVSESVRDFYCYKIYVTTNPKQDGTLMRYAYGNSNVALDVTTDYAGNPTGWTTGYFFVKVTAVDKLDNETPKPIYYPVSNKALTIDPVIGGEIVTDDAGKKSFEISWAPVSGAVKYRVFKMYNQGAWIEQASQTTNTISDTKISQTTGVRYDYRIIAVDFWGNESNYSNTLTDTVP